MRRRVLLRFDIWLCMLLAYGVSLGAVKLTELILPVFYERYVEENTIPQNEIGGPAGADVFRAESVADLLDHDVFTVVSPGIQYYNHGSSMYHGMSLTALELPSGEFVAAAVNRQNIQTGEDYYSSDHILPVGRVVYEDLTADNTLMEQLQYRDTVLSRTDFYVDMQGTGGLISQEEHSSRWTGVVQVAAIIVFFPIFHSIGARLGLFPFFFPPKPKKGEKKSEWD